MTSNQRSGFSGYKNVPGEKPFFSSQVKPQQDYGRRFDGENGPRNEQQFSKPMPMSDYKDRSYNEPQQGQNRSEMLNRFVNPNQAYNNRVEGGQGMSGNKYMGKSTPSKVYPENTTTYKSDYKPKPLDNHATRGRDSAFTDSFNQPGFENTANSFRSYNQESRYADSKSVGPVWRGRGMEPIYETPRHFEGSHSTFVGRSSFPDRGRTMDPYHQMSFDQRNSEGSHTTIIKKKRGFFARLFNKTKAPKTLHTGVVAGNALGSQFAPNSGPCEIIEAQIKVQRVNPMTGVAESFHEEGLFTTLKVYRNSLLGFGLTSQDESVYSFLRRTRFDLDSIIDIHTRSYIKGMVGLGPQDHIKIEFLENFGTMKDISCTGVFRNSNSMSDYRGSNFRTERPGQFRESEFSHPKSYQNTPMYSSYTIHREEIRKGFTPVEGNTFDKGGLRRDYGHEGRELGYYGKSEGLRQDWNTPSKERDYREHGHMTSDSHEPKRGLGTKLKEAYWGVKDAIKPGSVHQPGWGSNESPEREGDFNHRYNEHGSDRRDIEIRKTAQREDPVHIEQSYGPGDIHHGSAKNRIMDSAKRRIHDEGLFHDDRNRQVSMAGDFYDKGFSDRGYNRADEPIHRYQ